MSADANKTENWSKDYLAELDLTEARRQKFQQDGLMTTTAQLQDWVEVKRVDSKAPWPQAKSIK